MSDTVYIYQVGKDNVEVVLTGRTATKERGRRKVVLHEIASSDKEIGFRSWVKLEQLFILDD